MRIRHAIGHVLELPYVANEGFDSSTGALAIEMAENGDATAPTLTSFAVTGADGAPVRTTSVRGAKLGFSAADGIITEEGTRKRSG